MKKFVLVLFSLILLSFDAAAKFSLIGTNLVGDKIYVDYDSAKIKDGLAKVWSFTVYSKSHQGVKSQKSLSQYDCQNETFSILDITSFKDFAGTDIYEYRFDGPTKPKPVPPNSTLFTIMKDLCK